MKPRTTTGADTLRRARRTDKWVARGNVLGSRGCPSKETGLKSQSALFKLPYWEVSVVVLWYIPPFILLGFNTCNIVVIFKVSLQTLKQFEKQKVHESWFRYIASSLIKLDLNPSIRA